MENTAIFTLRSDYGAIELKNWIRVYTWRAFYISLAIFLISFGGLFLNNKINEAKKIMKLAPPVKVTLTDILNNQEMEAAPPPPPTTVVNTGPAARAGTPVPVPDADIAPDVQEFANMDIMSRASAAGGDGIDVGGFASNIDFNGGKKIDVQKAEAEPDPEEFFAGQEPTFDIVTLTKSLEYPAIARQAGIEGTVVIRALISKTGAVTKTLIISSDNVMLEANAVKAVKNFKDFQPAIQNKQAVQCWVTIPIVFRLR